MNGNVLERIVESTRDDVRRRQASVPLRELEQALAAHRDDRPFSEALTRPGVSLIAEHKRRSPSAGTIREGATVGRRRARLRARRRGGGLDPHRGRALRRLARRPPRGARELPSPGAAQGLHRRRRTRCTRPRPPAPTRCCSSSPRSRSADLTELYARGAGARPRRPRGGPRRARSSSSRSRRSTPTSSASTTATSRTSPSISTARTSCCRRSRRARRWCPSRASTAAISSTTSSASASTPSSWARRSCARPTWRTPSARSSGTTRL